MLICLCDFPPACPLGERCDLWRAPGEMDPLHFLPLISMKHEDAVCTRQAGRPNPEAVVLNSDGELGVEKMGHVLPVSGAAGSCLVLTCSSGVPAELSRSVNSDLGRSGQTNHLTPVSCQATGPTLCCLNDHPASAGQLPGMVNTLHPE